MSRGGGPGVGLLPSDGEWSDRVRAALADTDWDRHPVVDIVHYAPATSLGLEGDRPRTEIHRHGEDPPAPDHYATPERFCRLERVTRPVYERLDR